MMVRRASPIVLLDLFQLFDDDVAQLLLRTEDGFVLGDAVANFAEFFQDFVDRKAGQAVQLQFEDCVGLHGVEWTRECRGANALEGHRLASADFSFGDTDRLAGEVLDQVGAGVGAVLTAADDADDVVHAIERGLVAFEDVLAVARLLQAGMRCGGAPRRCGDRRSAEWPAPGPSLWAGR